MLRNYFNTALRQIAKRAGYTTINLLGLTVGVCACLAIWLITHFELTYDRFHPDGERIYRLVSQYKELSGNDVYSGNVPEPAGGQARVELSGIEKVAKFYNYNASVQIPSVQGKTKKFEKIPGDGLNGDFVFAEPQYFEIFKYQWVAGEPGAALNEPFRVVLSTKEVQKYFGLSDDWGSVLGRQVIYDDSLTVTVSGVVKDWDANTDLTFKDFISYSTIGASFVKNDIDLNNWSNFNGLSQTFVKLARGVTPDRIEAELQAFAVRHITVFQKSQHFQILLQPLSDLHFNASFEKLYGRQANLPALHGLLYIAAFILIIASINFINLSLSQALGRGKEIALRKVLGSSRSSLIFHFLIETFLLTLFSLVISLIIVLPILSLFSEFVPKELTFKVFDFSTVVFVLLLLFVTTFLSGFYPAYALSSMAPARALKSQARPKQALKAQFQKILIVFQFSISIIFIIAAIIGREQIHFILNKQLGFSKDAIIHITTDGKDPYDKRKLLAERIRLLQGVEMVSMDRLPPAFDGNATTKVYFSGRTTMKISTDFRVGDENYIPLYGISLVAGRNLFHSDTLREVVINQTLSKILGCSQPGDAIGKNLFFWGRTCQIVGVMADFNHNNPLHNSIGPVMVTSFAPMESGYSVKLATNGNSVGSFNRTTNDIRELWASTFPDKPFDYIFYDETIKSFYIKEQAEERIATAAMIITIILSCLGLFALVGLSAQQRTREIGVRKVLGASVTNVAIMISRSYVILVLSAFVISAPIAYFLMQKWLQDFANRIDIGSSIFIVAGILVILITLATVSFHAIKAAIADPIKSLRTEG